MPLKYIPGEFTGIYQQYRWSADDPVSMRKAFEAITDSMDIDVQLDRLERQALKTFSENCNGPDWYPSLPDEAEPIAKDARETLWQVRIVRDFIKQGDLRNAVLHALKLGSAAERMDIRPFERPALIGQQVQEGARKGQAAVYGTRKEKEQEWAKWQQQVDRIFAKKPRLSHRAIARAVAAKFRVSEESILRRTHHPGRLQSRGKTDKQKK